MSAYFLHQPSRAKLTLSPSISSKDTSQQSISRASEDSTLKIPIISLKETTTPEENQKKSATRTLLKNIQQRWKDHHESVQESYELYYGQGTSTGRVLGNPFVAPPKKV